MNQYISDLHINSKYQSKLIKHGVCCLQNNQSHNITPLFGCIPWD
jgi:hypothetical protein